MQLFEDWKEIISLLGPPGAGKGTIAQEWKEAHEYAVLSTGALCRFHVAQQTEIGKQFSVLLDKGQLIPDQLISTMVQEWLAENVLTHNGIILDGYPRTGAQAESALDFCRTNYPSYLFRVVLFEISPETVITRLSKRLVCSNKDCQRVHRIIDEEPVSVCSACGSQLIRRRDDTPEVIRKRFADYEALRDELLTVYQREGVLISKLVVDDLSFDQMFSQFTALLHGV